MIVFPQSREYSHVFQCLFGRLPYCLAVRKQLWMWNSIPHCGMTPSMTPSDFQIKQMNQILLAYYTVPTHNTKLINLMQVMEDGTFLNFGLRKPHLSTSLPCRSPLDRNELACFCDLNYCGPFWLHHAKYFLLEKPCGYFPAAPTVSHASYVCKHVKWFSLAVVGPPALHASFYLAQGHLMPHQQINRHVGHHLGFSYGQFIRTKLSSPSHTPSGLNYFESFFSPPGFHRLKYANSLHTSSLFLIRR